MCFQLSGCPGRSARLAGAPCPGAAANSLERGHARLESGIEKHERPIDGDVTHAAHKRQERRAVENGFPQLCLDVQARHLGGDVERLETSAASMPVFGAANGDAICRNRSNPSARSVVPGESGTSIKPQNQIVAFDTVNRTE